MKTEKIREIIAAYGTTTQSIVAMEECSEMIKEISKLQRGVGDVNHLAEEMADVMICIEQMQIIYGITDEKLYGWKQRKEKRNEERLKEFKKENEWLFDLRRKSKMVTGDDWSD